MNKINRKQLVSRHNPILKNIDYSSPLSVGNGEFCFTADITGFQSFSESYEQNDVPLCTMANWAWHTSPFSATQYAPKRSDLQLTTYETPRGKHRYAVLKHPGNETVYDWFRENPHRLNVGRISLKDASKQLEITLLQNIQQELHLYEGFLESNFTYKDVHYTVLTICDPQSDTISFLLHTYKASANDTQNQTPCPIPDYITIEIQFPYGSPKKEASEWNTPHAHSTTLIEQKNNTVLIERTLDHDTHFLTIFGSSFNVQNHLELHRLVLQPESASSFEISFNFTKEHPNAKTAKNNQAHTTALASFATYKNKAQSFWYNYWETGGAIDFSASTDPRWFELERRVILSQYLLMIQSCGSLPPQETGLTCNSWYGKFHLEMYPFHTAWLALWNHSEVLQKSLAWFKDNLDKAKANAKANNFLGARWPKMIGPDAIDSPSPIATLLIWQQPHLLFILELIYAQTKNLEVLHEFKSCIYETAEFMADFAEYNEATGKWDLIGPIIPVQEEFDPKTVKNPTFEVAYWKWGLEVATKMMLLIHETPSPKWSIVAQNMASLPIHNSCYSAHENCPNTFSYFNKDHPSMLMALGFIPNVSIDASIMKNTLDTVIKTWDYSSIWGWDFAIMALTAARLGEPALAINLLLFETSKNSYVASGHNKQSSRKDLPLYLPGNGSLLLAVAHLASTGVFNQGNWSVVAENISPFLE